MNKEISAFELDDIRTKLWYGMSALNAIHTAMIDVSGNESDFTAGLLFVWCGMSQELRRLDGLLDGEKAWQTAKEKE